MTPVRIVKESELREKVREPEAFAAVERAFRAIAAREVVQPHPMGFDFPEAGGEVHVKGAYLAGAPIFAIKVASGFYPNAKRGLPAGSGLVLVLDAKTGFPLALLLDNAYLTELRTGAAGALATDRLAPASVEKMAMIGTGSQARYQLRAIARVRRPGRVVAWSPSPEHRARYCEEMREALQLEVEPAESAEDALANATLVVTVTPSRSPLVPARFLAEGATIVAVGSDGPDKQELDVDVLARADKILADSLSQCERLGEIHHALDAGVVSRERIYGELSDVVSGALPGREREDELIVCDLTGVGAQDAALAETVWRTLSPTLAQSFRPSSPRFRK
jgi:ornithine cyclodeaminase/alanine dehydrogenase-like protein (mu-crystallin family)